MAESTLRVPSTSRLAPASGMPNLAARARAGVSQPGSTRNGAATVAPIRVTTLPATFPQAKLIAPRWAKASSSVTAVVTTKPAASTTSRRPCMNSRLIRLNGTQTNPSMSTHSDSSRTRLVAPGDPRKSPPYGAK